MRNKPLFTSIFIYFHSPINKQQKSNQQFFKRILARFSGLIFSANHLVQHVAFPCQTNNICGTRHDPSGQVARGHEIFSKSIFHWEAEGPGSLLRPPLRRYACPRLPPHARPLPLQRPAPLRVISLARVESWRTRLDIHRQARPWGSCSCLFPCFPSGPCSRHFPEPLQGPHTRGISFRTIPGLYFSPETCSCALKTPRGTRLGVKSKKGTHVLATCAVVF